MQRRTLVRMLSPCVVLLIIASARADHQPTTMARQRDPGTVPQEQQEAPAASSAHDEPPFPPVQRDVDTLLQEQRQALAAPRANIDEGIKRRLEQAEALNQATSMDLLDCFNYDLGDRDQEACGNCWVWAGAGVMEIALCERNGIRQRLSIQYLNSCRSGCACDGGKLDAFAAWYAAQGRAIPWANTNAFFADTSGQCPSSVPCNSISTEPYFPINSIVAQTIETHDGQSDAISNIKNVLNQGRGVFVALQWCDEEAWYEFRNFFQRRGDTPPLETPWGYSQCGHEYVEAEGGGHAVLIVGYNDDDPDPANHYWIVLNSQGSATGRRPNGLFRMPMHLYYDCECDVPGTLDDLWVYTFRTLAVDFGNSPPVADAGGPYEAECQGLTTPVWLDGRGSRDLDSPYLDFSWSADCTGLFDDPTLFEPVLTLPSDPGNTDPCDLHLTVTDYSGNTDTDSTTVTVRDTLAPVLECAADVTVECPSSTDPFYTGRAKVYDRCDETPLVDYDDLESPASCSAEKTITRQWWASDGYHTTSCEQTIDVQDTEGPKLDGVPADVTVECDAVPPVSAVVTAYDYCDPDHVRPVSYSQERTAGACPNSYTLTRRWTAHDSCYNYGMEPQVITVEDTTPPVLAGVPANMTVECDAVPPPPTVTATDNCDGQPGPPVSFSEVQTPGACSGSYTLARTWTAADACTNTGSAQQIITVEDTTPPEIQCNTPETIEPSDAPVTFTATGTDNCAEKALLEIKKLDCFAYTNKGKRIDRTDGCVVDIAGDSLTILEAGGVDSYITWQVRAADDCGNQASEKECQVKVVRPGRAP